MAAITYESSTGELNAIVRVSKFSVEVYSTEWLVTATEWDDGSTTLDATDRSTELYEFITLPPQADAGEAAVREAIEDELGRLWDLAH